METNHVARIVDALDSAIAILRDAEGRRNAADIRVQSILAAARDTLASREPLASDLRRKREAKGILMLPADNLSAPRRSGP